MRTKEWEELGNEKRRKHKGRSLKKAQLQAQPERRTEVAFPRRMASPIRCRSHWVSRGSLLRVAARFPISLKKESKEGPMTPAVPTAIGCTVKRSVRPEYLQAFASSAFDAAVPASEAERRMLVAANVSTQVASQTRDFPWENGTRVRPSGRFPSPRSRPAGSRQEGIPAASKPRLTKSLRSLWRGNRPALRLHDKG